MYGNRKMPHNEIFILTLCLTTLVVCAKRSSLEVHTELGDIRGQTVSTLDGRKVDAFLGIPYGAPTNGPNRFSPPKEPEAWNGVLDATKFSSPCFQVTEKERKQDSWYISNKEESENCLTINVWVPKPRPKSSAVMVWIHGGGFSVGSSDVPLYNGATLAAQENIIVVSLNYRLSIFGFLYLEHPLAPGNVGMMDQTMALQWVQKNIRTFGGDPNKVTIFGESAGGASVGLHLLAPSSLDLFQNAILQSGSPLCLWATSTPKNALRHSLDFAKVAGCPVEDNNRDETVKCLQGLSGEELLDAALKHEDQLIKMVFLPISDGSYLPASPAQLFTEGKFCTDKKIMLGITKDEGSFIMAVFAPQFMNKKQSTFTEQELKKIISLQTRVNEIIPDFAVELVSHVYSEWNPDSSNFTLTIKDVVRFVTDRWFGCAVRTTADDLVNKGSSVFFYRFDYSPKPEDPNNQVPGWFGASHTDELPFLFGAKLSVGSDEVKLTKQMMRYWSNFAKTGDPNDEYLPVWPKYTYKEKKWLQFDRNNLSVGRTDRLKECAFWNNLFPKMDLS